MVGSALGRSAMRAGAAVLAVSGLIAGPARAELREYTCYDLVQPVGSVLELRLWVRALSVHDRRHGLPYRYAGLEAVLGAVEQGLGDQVAGKVLHQELVCDTTRGQCETPDSRHRMALFAKGDLVRLVVTDMPVGDFGNSMLLSNLAHPVGRPLRFDLALADAAICPQSAHSSPLIRP
jgi:hypothetical protein